MVGKMKAAASETQQILIQNNHFNIIEFTLKQLPFIDRFDFNAISCIASLPACPLAFWRTVHATLGSQALGGH